MSVGQAILIFSLVFLHTCDVIHTIATDALLKSFNDKVVTLGVLDKMYNNFVQASEETELRDKLKMKFINYFEKNYQETFIWLHHTTSANKEVPRLNLLAAAELSSRGKSSDIFLDFLDDVKKFEKLAKMIEFRYLYLSGQSQETVDAIVKLYNVYSKDIKASIDEAYERVAEQDLQNGEFIEKAKNFVKTKKLDLRRIHQDIHDFLVKKYYFRTWLVVLIDKRFYSRGCHRSIKHAIIPITGTVEAIAYNVPKDSKFDKAEATKLINKARIKARDLDCGDDAKDVYEELNINCDSLSWTKMIGVFYDDRAIFRGTVTNGSQYRYVQLKTHGACDREFVLIIFG